jgi:ribosomal protein S18 acetylase RimI-like enzyme
MNQGKKATAAFCLFYREWESGILEESRWGLKWAASRSEKELASALCRVPELFRKLKASSVAARVPMSSHGFTQMLERSGFLYVGGLVTLRMDLRAQAFHAPSKAVGVSIRDAGKRDMAPLTLIAREAFREGRFHHEPGLKAGAAQKIYGTWAKNMLNYADEVRVAAGKSQLGFVSLKKDPENKRLWIDLIAVAPQAQSQGIGALLAVESWKAALRQKGWDLAVKTEPENLGALRFYLKNGFTLESFQLDYIWRAKKS